MKKYQHFYLKTFGFLLVKFSIYLKRSVFVMYLVADPEKERGLKGMGSV